MVTRTLLIVALAALAVAAPSEGRFGCLADAPSTELLAVAQQMQAQEASSALSRIQVQKSIAVDIYFHVVSASDSVTDGNVPDSQLQDQVNVLNEAYAPHSIQFSLKGTDRTINATWADNGDEMAMKAALRKGSYRDLNIYFLRHVNGAAGYCYLPANTTINTSIQTRDGCSILAFTVPGGSQTNYNMGLTTVHEVGHWMGLFHTFEGNSCTGSGDSISDTPQQMTATTGCPSGKDTCPDSPGLDAIHNYMDYSYDSCYVNFTAGQHTRMYSMWDTYRGQTQDTY